jgi:predicted acyltransferase
MSSASQSAPLSLTEQPREPLSTPTTRLVSLDALRGFDMFWIVGGAAICTGLAKPFHSPALDNLLQQFEHVPWQGLHFFDVIWPLFMFIAGVSLAFSLVKRKAAGADVKQVYFHAGKRAVLLFILGMIAQGDLLAFDLSKLHPCYSVLHGIAAGYFLATIVTLHFGPRGQAIVTAAFLLAYWALLMLIPVPGAGVLTPDANAATYIDRLVLGRFQYGKNTWFLSYLGFASSIMAGVLAGEFLMSQRSQKAKTAALLCAGAALVVVGLLWSLWLPIIKLLWTSSFVVLCAGLSLLLMGVFYFVLDVLAFRRWAFPFIVIGMNSIVAYMVIMLIDLRAIGNVFVGGLLPRLGDWGALVEAVAAFAVLWLILFWMYRTKSFVKI